MANNSQTVSLSWSMKVSQRETCFTTTKIPSSSKKHFEKLNYLLWSIHFQLKFHYKVYYPVVLNPLTPGSETWQILLCLTPHNFTHQLVPSIKVIFGFWNPTKFTFDLRTPCWWWVCQIKKYIHVHYKWDVFTSSFWSSKLNFSFGTSQMVFWQNILLRSSPFKCWPFKCCQLWFNQITTDSQHHREPKHKDMTSTCKLSAISRYCSWWCKIWIYIAFKYNQPICNNNNNNNNNNNTCCEHY